MKKLLSVILSGILVFSCSGLTATAYELPEYTPEQLALIAIENAAVPFELPIFEEIDPNDGSSRFVYAKANEEIVLSGVQAIFDARGLEGLSPEDYLECVDCIQNTWNIKSAIMSYIRRNHWYMDGLSHIFIDFNEEDFVTLEYDNDIDPNELEAVKNWISELYLDETKIRFLPGDLITDADQICEMLRQFTEDQKFPAYTWIKDGVIWEEFTYAQEADEARAFYNAFMTANGIDKSMALIEGSLEGGGNTSIRLRGDVNANKEVTAGDAQLVLNNALDLMLGNTAEPLSGADIDGDGEVTSLDAQYILMYYLNNTIMEAPTMWKDIIQ